MQFSMVEEDNIKLSKKTFFYDYGEYDEKGKGPATMIAEIMESEHFPHLKELVIGSWGGAYEEDCQAIIDDLVANAEQFSHIEKLFIGNMGFEDCEVSWIMQGDYSKLWEAMPQLKELTIKGSMGLELGEICHEELEALTIICGGLSKNVIQSIQKAKLPKLKKLLLFIGIEDYGFDGDEDTVRELLEQADFPALTYLGITNSEIQDELTEAVLNSKFMGQISTLDLSNGTLTDKGGALLLEKIPAWPNIEKLDLHYNYLSDDMAEKLGALAVEVDVSEQEKAEKYKGEIYRSAMLTE
ncbi:MAG: STM4015 family protein [Lachnospiraceae bacterium]|nr:STM4015 family protein [Lachnospiraceae bacterium]MDE7272431.1 STM4015 family protein [Lachnospiraceae bacterium]